MRTPATAGAGLILAGLGLALTGCSDPPPAPRPTTVVVNPPAEQAQMVVAAMPPPPPQTELVPPPPIPGAVWQPGHWRYTGAPPNGWDWVGGVYVQPPVGRSVWMPGQWQQAAGGGWVWSEGHWM